MPNWCENSLWVDGDKTSLQRFRKDVNSEEHDFVLSKLHPMPEAVLNTDDTSDTPNWHDWRTKNWGTKWDVEGILTFDDSEILEYRFLSAWSPPVPWLKKVSKGYPRLQFRLQYLEAGVGFMGVAKFKNGKVNETCY